MFNPEQQMNPKEALERFCKNLVGDGFGTAYRAW